MLFGQIDDACQCIWIDMAAGPPPDSTLSAIHFQHGTEGARQLADYHRARSQGNSVFTGMWHTHPDHPARPSPTDAAGIRTLLATVPESPRSVMVILGGPSETWTTWLDDSRPPDIYSELVRHDPSQPRQEMPVPQSHASSAWPGGYITADKKERSGNEPQPRPRWLRRFWWPRRKGTRR
jgi:integrative and conjugative element protein (TIGR02256 family)